VLEDEEFEEIGHWCGPGGMHLPTIVTTMRLRDCFRKRYWIKCWECDLVLGPYTASEADKALRLMNMPLEASTS
jgi:hypothetical protein